MLNDIRYSLVSARMVLASAENGFLPGQRTPERPVAIHLEAQGVAETPALPGVAPAASALLVSCWKNQSNLAS